MSLQSVPVENSALAVASLLLRQRLTERLASAKLSELYAAGWSDRQIALHYGTESRWTKSMPLVLLPRTAPGVDLAPSSAPEARLFLRTLDALPVGLAFFDRQEALLSSNRVLLRLLDEAPDAERLQQEILHFVHSLTTLLGIRHPAATEVQELATRKVIVERTTYRIRGSYIGFDLFGAGSTLLITVEPVTVGLPCPEEIRRRFGLTPKECQITLLLAEGKSNAEIAKELFLSPHTARTHTKRILEKLGVHSRAEIRPMLQGL